MIDQFIRYFDIDLRECECVCMRWCRPQKNKNGCATIFETFLRHWVKIGFGNIAGNEIRRLGKTKASLNRNGRLTTQTRVWYHTRREETSELGGWPFIGVTFRLFDVTKLVFFLVSSFFSPHIF